MDSELSKLVARYKALDCKDYLTLKEQDEKEDLEHKILDYVLKNY